MSQQVPEPRPEDVDRLIQQLQSEETASQLSALKSEQSLLEYIKSVFAVDSPQKQNLIQQLTISGPALLQLLQRALGI